MEHKLRIRPFCAKCESEVAPRALTGSIKGNPYRGTSYTIDRSQLDHAKQAGDRNRSCMATPSQLGAANDESKFALHGHINTYWSRDDSLDHDSQIGTARMT